MGFNYYQAYYQGKYAEPKPSYQVDRTIKVKGQDGTISSKQFEYHSALIAFMKSKGLKTSHFERPRNSAECSRKIRAILTTLRKTGLDKEFFGVKQDGEES